MPNTEASAYTVTMRFQFPFPGEQDGIEFDIASATSKSDAIRQARRQADRDGHSHTTGQGRVTFKAEIAQ